MYMESVMRAWELNLPYICPALIMYSSFFVVDTLHLMTYTGFLILELTSQLRCVLGLNEVFLHYFNLDYIANDHLD